MDESEDEKFSPKEILNDIKNLDKELETLFNQNNKDKTRILLLGPTGCGKTTLMHLLSNCNMKEAKVKTNVKPVLCCDGNCKVNKLAIGHQQIAETRIPGIIEEDNYLLCDCPGFLDNRSLAQRILNSYSIKKLLEPPCKIKILLFLNQYHFLADRIIYAIKLIEEAEQFFEDYYQFEQCVGLVVTKVEPEITIEQLLSPIDEKEFKKHPLLNFFSKHPEKCFRICQPPSTVSNFNNKCKNDLLAFFKGGYVSDPKHQTIMDSNTIQQLCLKCDQMNDNMNEYLVQFSHGLAEKYRNEKEIDKLEKWIEIIKKLRFAAAQGLNKFYEAISQHEEFGYIVETLELYLVWGLFYDQVVSTSNVSSSSKYLFKCQSIIKTFDDQVNELQVMRDNLDQQNQILRDKSASKIIDQLDQYIKSGGVIITHEISFFALLDEHPFHYFPKLFLKKLKPIDIELDNEDDDDIFLEIKMNNKGVKLLVDQMEEILNYCFVQFGLIKDHDVSESVLSQLKNTNIDPDEMKEFKKFKPTAANKAAGIFENFAHPINVVTAIPVSIGLVIGTGLKKKRDIKNIEKMDQWYFDGTLTRKIQFYEFMLKPMMIRYQKIAKLCQQNFSISFTFGGRGFNPFPFEKIEPILPNDGHLFLITQCQSMTNIIANANTSNSMDVFNGVYSLYHKVSGEINNLAIDISGEKLYQMAANGEEIDNILTKLSDDISKPAFSLNDKVVLYSQILASTRMMGAINGRGLGSHERKNLFGLKTVVNSQNESGRVCVYSKKNIQDINNNIISHVQDIILTIENSSDDDIGDFSPESFVKTVRAFKKSIEKEYDESQNDISESICSIIQSLTSIVDEIPNNPNSDKEGAKLLNKLEKIKGVEIEKQTKKEATVNFNGSIVTFFIRNLLGLAPLISNAIKSSKRYRRLKKKMDKLNKIEPLIRLYQHTTYSMKNPRFQGVILVLDDEKIISIEDIILA